MSNKEEAIKCYLDGLAEATKAFIKHQNLFIFCINAEIAKLQASIILSQPTLPEFATGGIVPANTRTGDIITVPRGESSLQSIIPDLKAYEYTDGYIIGVDTGKPGGDWS